MKKRMIVVSAVAVFLMLTGQAAYAEPGQLDPNFGTGGIVRITWPSPDRAQLGPVMIGPNGALTFVGAGVRNDDMTNPRFGIVKLTRRGRINTSWGANGFVTTDFTESVGIRALLALPRARVLAIGGATDPTTSARGIALAKYARDGSLDPSFGLGGTNVVYFPGTDDSPGDAFLQDDGSVVMGSHSNVLPPGPSSFALLRFTPNGFPDPSFGDGGKLAVDLGPDVFIDSLQQLSDGRLLAFGSAGDSTGRQAVLARLNPDGALDETFAEGGIARYSAGAQFQMAVDVLVREDGGIVLGGRSFSPFESVVSFMVGLDAHGAIDESFGDEGVVRYTEPGDSSGISSLHQLPNGQLLLEARLFETTFSLSRYDAVTGALDTTYGNDGRVYAPSTIPQFGSAVNPQGDVTLTGLDLDATGEPDVVLRFLNN